MGDELASRTVEEVFEDHLRLGQHGTVAEELSRDDADHVFVLAADGVHRSTTVYASSPSR